MEPPYNSHKHQPTLPGAVQPYKQLCTAEELVLHWLSWLALLLMMAREISSCVSVTTYLSVCACAVFGATVGFFSGGVVGTIAGAIGGVTAGIIVTEKAMFSK